MFRAFKARRIVRNKMTQRAPPTPAPATPKIVPDEQWRLDENGKMVRTCVLRGTPLHLSAATFNETDSPSEEWEYILLVATLCEDGHTSEDDGKLPEASVKLWRNRISNELYLKPVQLAPNICEDGTNEKMDMLKTMLTNIFPDLDLFYAGKNGVMILKFNGPA